MGIGDPLHSLGRPCRVGFRRPSVSLFYSDLLAVVKSVICGEPRPRSMSKSVEMFYAWKRGLFKIRLRFPGFGVVIVAG
jgi:hypothetical protein